MRKREVYKKRYKIERTFGNLKNNFGSYVEVKSLAMGTRFVLLTIILYNFWVYLKLIGESKERAILIGFIKFEKKANFLPLKIFSNSFVGTLLFVSLCYNLLCE